MSTPTPPQDDTGQEPPTADLSELTATDALLDRLAARDASEQDLLDPTAMALNTLLTEIDAEAGADNAMARLVEVLAGRPLYIDGPSVTADVSAGAAPETIDLTDAAPDVPVAAVPITAARSSRRRRWQVAASKVSAPVAAASIAVMVVLGGGVSAAVAGDPMAPLDGVGRVMAKLPGIDSSGYDRKDAQKELELAASLAATDPDAAREHYQKAQAILADLPDDKKSDLMVTADAVAAVLVPGDPTEPGVVPVGTATTPGDAVTTVPGATGTPTAVPATDVTASPTSGGGGTTASTPPSSTTTTAPTTSTGPTTSSAPSSTANDSPTSQTSAPTDPATQAPTSVPSAASPDDVASGE
ncbi:hypothetical protein [Kineosporia succinea]|uniref:Anti-sigma-D factor RsdA-like protein n=1 Tax=Kineosporia succinea TaxID=84632 RepID=A0ABT9P3I1_9ACTN|nr:hypothetical protein [Kineosporia succinea]MDP9827239.1 hypothetical protein [Kineosporia succinea]